MNSIFTEHSNNFEGNWKKLIGKWGEMNGLYFGRNGDLPAWYIENSNSALLSAAAWQCGGVSLCELDIEKLHYNGKRGRPRTYPGRFDIQISFDQEDYLVEAKRRCFVLSSQSQYSLRHSYLATSIEEAMADTRSCRRAASDAGQSLVSIVFFAGMIEPDAIERKHRHYRKACSMLIENEVSAFGKNMERLAENKRFEKLRYALFTNPLEGLTSEWSNYNWPALCGLSAVF